MSFSSISFKCWLIDLELGRRVADIPPPMLAIVEIPLLGPIRIYEREPPRGVDESGATAATARPPCPLPVAERYRADVEDKPAD